MPLYDARFVLCPSTTRDLSPRERKLAAIVASARVIAPEDALRGLEGLLEGGRDFGQLLGRCVSVKSKGPGIAPLQVERIWMISSKNALGQCHLVAQESPGFGEFAGVYERR